MSRLRDVECVALAADEEIDPDAWERTMEYFCRLMLEDYFKKHPKAGQLPSDRGGDHGTGMGSI